MPMLLTSNSIPPLHEGNSPNDGGSLTSSLAKVSLNKSRLSGSDESPSDASLSSNLQGKLGSVLIRQQEIQNELSFSESQARAAKKAGNLLSEILESEEYKRDGESVLNDGQEEKLLSELKQLGKLSFNGRNLFEGNLAQSEKTVPVSKEGTNEFITNIHNFKNVQTVAENRVDQLRKDSQELNMQNANIHAVGGRISDSRTAQNSIHVVREKFLSISAASIRVQANVNFDNSLMFLG